ncbi:MAG: hypothetical protein QM479_12440 [Pseudomonadota bacterium]
MIHRFNLWLVIGLSFVYSVGYSSLSYATGEHQRRFAVELAIAAGDSRLLLNSNKLSVGKQLWIKQRVIAAVQFLPLLARYYQQERHINDAQLDKKLHQLLLLLEQPQSLHAQLIKLSRQYPLNFSLIIPQKLDTLSLKKIAKLYNSLCIGCHLGVATDNSVVVGKLALFANTMDKDEWLARLIAGLHGDAYTRLENPFSDQQIALFHSYIRFHLAD